MFLPDATPISLQTDSAHPPPACSPWGYQRVWAILTRLLGAFVCLRKMSERQEDRMLWPKSGFVLQAQMPLKKPSGVT